MSDLPGMWEESDLSGGWADSEQPVPTGEPVLPYGYVNPSSGFSGSSTSEAAVRAEDADGRTADKQQRALSLLAKVVTQPFDGEPLDRGRHVGLTWRELDKVTGWGHGSTSRVLSDLHKAGRIARLTEERNRCKVYVLPEYVNGRETEPHGGRGRDRQFVSTDLIDGGYGPEGCEGIQVMVNLWADGTVTAAIKPDPDARFSRWSPSVQLVEET